MPLLKQNEKYIGRPLYLIPHAQIIYNVTVILIEKL